MARVATWLGGALSVAAQIESGRERGPVAAVIATVFSITLIVTVEALFHRPRTPQAPAASPTSPGMRAAEEYDAPAALAYREAAERLRRESRLAGLNQSE